MSDEDRVKALKEIVTMMNKDKTAELPPGLLAVAGVKAGCRIKDVEKLVKEANKKISSLKKVERRIKDIEKEIEELNEMISSLNKEEDEDKKTEDTDGKLLRQHPARQNAVAYSTCKIPKKVPGRKRRKNHDAARKRKETRIAQDQDAGRYCPPLE